MCEPRSSDGLSVPPGEVGNAVGGCSTDHGVAAAMIVGVQPTR